MAKDPRLLEAIENAKAAVASTRGMYPYTTTTNVFNMDGTSLDEAAADTDDKDDDGEKDDKDTLNGNNGEPGGPGDNVIPGD